MLNATTRHISLMRFTGFGVILLVSGFLLSSAATAHTESNAVAPVLINEIRIDQPASDTDEYFELSGPPGGSLTGLTYLVIGDTGTTSSCGFIEAVIDLTGLSIQADGLLVVAEATVTSFTADATRSLSFENSDNVTHMVVEGFTGSVGDKLDTDDNGTLDITPWSSVLDAVGLDEGKLPNCAGDEFLYTTTTVGPDASFVPGHVFLCTPTWIIGGFALGTDDTPGEPNDCPVQVEERSWGRVKSTYR